MSLPAREPELLLQHAGYVRALARAVVFDAEQAREVEQETWLAALQRAPRDLRRPRAWLAALVRHAARRLWKRSAARAAREDSAGRDHAPAQLAVAPDELLEREQALRTLVAAVRRLPEPQRAAIVLHYLDQLALHEVARRTGAPLETVRSRVKRGLELLRADLERRRGDAWSLALVRALALEPPRLLIAMSFTSKVAVVLVAVSLVAAAGWFVRSETRRSEVAQHAAAEVARVALEQQDRVAPVTPAPPARIEQEPAAAPARASDAATGSIHAELVWGDDGTPAGGVPVRVGAVERLGRFPRRSVSSDPAGVLALGELAPGAFVLQPILGGLAFVSVGAGETTELRLEIPPGIRVRGVVRDHDGAPVQDADVFLDGGAQDPQYEGAVVARSDARGRFELRCAPAQVGASLSARAAGRAPTTRLALTGAPRTSVELELVFEHEGRALSGRVIDDAGASIAGAQVLVGSEREIVPELRSDGTLAWKPIGELADTDADGRFAVAGVPLGAVPVQVRAAGHAPWRGECDGGWLEVRLARGASVAGVVRDAAGAPLAGAYVRAGGGASFAGAEAVSDARGAYVLADLAAGSVELEADERAHGRATRTFALSAGARTTWDPVLGAGPALAGRVEAPGEELAGWTVRAWADGGERPYVEETRTDAAGRFELRACPAGELGLVLHGRGGTPFPVARLTGVRADGPELVLRPDPELAPSTRIVGRLVDERGAPVRNADVRATHARLGTTLVHPDAEHGTFEFARLPAGEWTLEVDAFTAGWAVERVSCALVPGETWDAGAILLGAGGTLRVTLRSSHGVAPRPRVAVVRDAEDRVAQWIALETVEACSRPLAPGRYRVALSADEGDTETTRDFVIVAGEETRVVLEQGEPATSTAASGG